MANETITLSNDYVHVLTENERAMNGGFTHKFSIPYTEVARATTATGSTDVVTINLPTSGTNFIVKNVMAYVRQAFAGAGGLALTVGTDDSANNFMTTASVLTTGPIVTGAGCVPTTLSGSFAAAANQLTATLTGSVSGSPSAVSAGQVDIYMALLNAANLG